MASLNRYTELFQAVADPNRLRILGCLLVRPACVCELVEATGLPQSRVSRHLGILKNAGLVQDRRNAQWVEYFIAPTPEGSPEASVLGLVKELLAADPATANDRARLVLAAKRRRADRRHDAQPHHPLLSPTAEETGCP